jgi:hypothetical protein
MIMVIRVMLNNLLKYLNITWSQIISRIMCNVHMDLHLQQNYIII